MGDPLADLLPNQEGVVKNPENQIDWEMWLVKNDSKYDFSIPINDSKNPVPINFKAGQTRAFPIHLAKWLAMQIAQRIIEAQWKEEEASGKRSNLLLQVADPETMKKKAALLLLGREEDFIEKEPVPVEPVKKAMPEGLKKWQEQQKAMKNR
jgi:hypothetical protein